MLIFALGLWALVLDVPVWNAVWYLPAWYGYLLALDAALFRLRGRSMVSEGAHRLLPLMLWSIPFWFLFEAYNLRLQNWWYVFVLRRPPAEALASALAFATVLPACLLHAEIVGELRRGNPSPAWGRVAMTPARLAGGLALGAAAAVAPLLFPRAAYWAVWFVPFLLAEPVLFRAGSPSLFSDLASGSWRRLASLLAGGLWAGLVWELFNFWARSKWLYTVPVFERPKLFEMPLLGYLGFPALAISAFSFVALLSLVAERTARAPFWRRPLVWAAPAAALFSAITLHFVLARTVVSCRPLLVELEGLDTRAAERLQRVGLPTPELFFRAVDRQGVDSVSSSTGLAPEAVGRAARHASLALHKGMGTENARLFERAGIKDVAALSRSDAEDVFRRLTAAARPDERMPSPALVRLWIAAAGPDGRPRR